MFNENEKKKIVHQRIAYQKSLIEVARMFGTSRIQIRKIETEYLNQLKESKNV
jgi:DNA-directed RNA polymerase sigma subunit (sigma70/sigma32)